MSKMFTAQRVDAEQASPGLSKLSLKTTMALVYSDNAWDDISRPGDEKQRCDVMRARDAASRAMLVPKRLGTSARNDPYAHDKLYFRSVEILTA